MRPPWKVVPLFLLSFCLLAFYMLASLSTEDVNYQRELEDLKEKVYALRKRLTDHSLSVDELVNSMNQMKEKKEEYKRREKFQRRPVPDRERTELRVTNVVKEQDTGCQPDKGQKTPRPDIQLLDVYKALPFDNLDGGVWKQGWELNYQPGKVDKERKLRVVVVPHSHCDPGWVKTFDEYYSDQMSSILSGMARHLGEKTAMRFIFAEVSFFEMWWREQNEETRIKVKKYLRDGQFEIATGGWVMADEANSHYFALVTELFEGHEWLRNELDYHPRTHWSIDPFGLSPSLPMLLSAANISNAVLQRVHYSVKKHLAIRKQLEFMWRQMWESDGRGDVKAHVFPFYSYDIPHTCGPEPAVCCQFDFMRLPGGGHTCPWNIPPKKIDDENVAQRAFQIYDQYRKKSQLFDTNVLLVPLGDDFRYASDFEWDEQHDNYQRLFAYMNSQKKWNVEARFGTLSDYFKLLDEELSTLQKKLPVLTGDFFTYADRDDHYWSGFFTSRPFYKQMDRVLQHYLRSADIAFSMASMDGFRDDQTFSLLVEARRWLSLFQHHDGVTGTAKNHVVADYGTKMLRALEQCEKVLAVAFSHFMGIKGLQMEEFRADQDILPEKRVYSKGSLMAVFNTLERVRKEPICLVVDSSRLRIDAEVPQQISPLFVYRNGSIEVDEGHYELCFVSPVGSWTAQTFDLVEGEVERTSIGTNDKQSISGFPSWSIDGDFNLSNERLQVTFDGTSGFIKSTRRAGAEEEVQVGLQFVHYGARKHKQMANGGGDSLSGAYLFLPDGEAKTLLVKNHRIVVLRGKIMNRVLVAGHKDVLLLNKVSLGMEADSIEIETEVDIRRKSNYELAMRFTSSVQSGDDLYTDLNGLQMIRRKRMLDKLPLQAHFYPMSTGAYIEDSKTRLSLLGAQALGVASLAEGRLEAILDRRLAQDDERGLFQGVLDNKRTVSRFRLLSEAVSGPLPSSETPLGYLTTSAHLDSREIYYPWIKMIASGGRVEKKRVDLLPKIFLPVIFMTLSKPGPDLLAENSAALILFRPQTDCRSSLPTGCKSGSSKLPIASLFPQVRSAHLGSLTLLYRNASYVKDVAPQPQKVQTVQLVW